MNGRIVRQGHSCSGKPSATVGTIWQCDCGRYWVKQTDRWTITSPLAVGLAGFADALAASQRDARRRSQLPRDGGDS